MYWRKRGHVDMCVCVNIKVACHMMDMRLSVTVFTCMRISDLTMLRVSFVSAVFFLKFHSVLHALCPFPHCLLCHFS